MKLCHIVGCLVCLPRHGGICRAGGDNSLAWCEMEKVGGLGFACEDATLMSPGIGIREAASTKFR